MFCSYGQEIFSSGLVIKNLSFYQTYSNSIDFYNVCYWFTDGAFSTSTSIATAKYTIENQSSYFKITIDFSTEDYSIRKLYFGNLNPYWFQLLYTE